MHNRLIITRSGLETLTRQTETKYCITACFNDSQLTEISCEPPESASLMGNIYVGRVRDIVKNLNAAFVEIQPDVVCYLPLENFYHPVYTKKSAGERLVSGDELLVQVSKDAIKTKVPTVTANLNLSGKYLALTTGNKKIGISAKIKGELRNTLSDFIARQLDRPYGVVLRTNAANVSKEEISWELKQMILRMDSLIKAGKHRTCYSRLYRELPGFLKRIQGLYSFLDTKILTDDEEIYQEIQEYLQEHQPEDLERLSLYTDKTYPLMKLYGIEQKIGDALKEKVWLKSGAYLVIQHTEAMTVIDVNSGKNSAKKNPQDNFLKINLEAGREIGRQLQLRNVSGICIIDFIDMKIPEHREELLASLKEEFAKDPVPTAVIDITKLGLVEVTRKKINKPLYEQIFTKNH